MSLLDELGSIDLSGVVDAKGLVSAALQSDEIQKLLSDGPAKSIMGDLDTVIAQLDRDLDDPEALIAPLLSAVATLAQQIRFDDAAVGQIITSVADGARIMAGVLGGLSGDPRQIQLAGGSIGDAFRAVGGPFSDYAAQAVGAIGRRRALLNAVEQGLPRDAESLANIALDILLPFPRAPLVEARTQVRMLVTGLGGLSLPQTRFQGLATALGQVSVAARAGDAAAVRTALDRLPRLRDEAISIVAGDLRGVAQQISALRLDQGLRVIAQASTALRTAEFGAIEELEEWRQRLVDARRLIDAFDPVQARQGAESLLDFIESELGSKIDAAMDQQVAKLEAWLRGLLRELPLRRIRDEISRVLNDAAEAIRGADIDRIANEIRGGIQALSDLITQVDLQALIDSAMQDLADAIRAALDELEAALATITAVINDVAAQVRAILEQVVAGIRSFREAADAVEALIAEANIEQATQDVIEALAALRAKAEELLSIAPLPDEMRPVVEQLAAQVRAIDIEEVIGAPLRQAAAALQIPADVGTTVQDGLQSVADVVANLIPDNIAAELQAELDGLFQRLQEIDLSSITGGLSETLDGIADKIEDLDPVALAQPASAAFDQVLAAFDRIRPGVLLQPAIEAYDNLLGQVPVPDPDTISTRAAQVVAAAGEPLARAATSPVQTLAGNAAQTREAPATEPPTRAEPPPTSGVRVGDLIRLIGFLPARLREAVQHLDAGAAGETMRQIQALCGGLAQEVRTLQAAITGIEENIERQFDSLLEGLAAAHLDAQLALSGGFRLQAGAVEVDASLDLVASVGPGALREALLQDLQLIEQRAGEAMLGLTGGAAARLDEIAATLEACALTRFGHDLDALLAALDPEPIAAEFDAVFVAVLEKAAGSIAALQADLQAYERRVRLLIERFNPGAQAQKLLRVLNVLREELDVLNPRRLADELDQIHAAIRDALAAYDPGAFARDLEALLNTTTTAVRGLDPAALVPDLTPVQTQINRIPGLLPVDALEAVGAELDSVGAELTALDVPGMLESVNALAPAVAAAIEETIVAVKAEILALLESIKYASSSASASGSVQISIGS